MEGWARGDYGPGTPLPDFIRNKPRVAAWHALYWDAFWDLMGDRAGMGDGRVMWVPVHLWARAHKISSRQEADLHYYIRAMDTVFLEHKAKQK